MYSLLLIIICCFLCVIRYLKIRNSFWKKRNVHHANGFLWRLLTGKKTLQEIIKEMYDDHSTLNNVGMILGINPYLIIRDLENIRAVLHGKFENFYARDLVPKNPNDILSENLLFTDDLNKWKLMRQILSPILSKSMFKKTFHISVRCARDFVDFIEENPKIRNDPYQAIYTYTIASISSKVFGIDKECSNTMITPYHKLADQILKPYLKFNMSFAFINAAPWLYKLMNMKIAGTHEDSFIQCIKMAMEKRRKNKEIQHDFIHNCLELEEKGELKDYTTGYKTNASLEFLATLAFVFFIGGIDTITATLHFSLLALSRNSKVLKKVHSEIDKEFQNNGGTLTYESIDNLEYLEMVVNEVIRIYPPIGVIQRRCCEDIILPMGKIKIEKGMKIVIPLLAIHKDERYHPKPEEFDPERFSADNIKHIVGYSHLPFSGGKRNCVGMRFAMMEMKTCLAWLLRRYTLKEQANEPIQFDPSYFILRGVNAHYDIIPRPEA